MAKLRLRSKLPLASSATDLWEQAYSQFETPQEEQKKFTRRLRKIGAAHWSRKSEVVELFCGRGNGLHALAALSFENIEGVDRSASLLAQYCGAARTYVSDCRNLPFESRTRDIVIVQGGLHHLESIPADLDKSLSEARRVLRPGGLFIAVEPWLTPFLFLVHALCGQPLVCRLWPKLNSLATMIELEGPVYESWVAQPQMILRLLENHFEIERCRFAWGKLIFVGRPRA